MNSLVSDKKFPCYFHTPSKRELLIKSSAPSNQSRTAKSRPQRRAETGFRSTTCMPSSQPTNQGPGAHPAPAPATSGKIIEPVPLLIVDIPDLSTRSCTFCLHRTSGIQPESCTCLICTVSPLVTLLACHNYGESLLENCKDCTSQKLDRARRSSL